MITIDEQLRFKSGIYMIINIQNGKRYIGSSANIYNRLHEHLHNLKFNKAHNKHLQAAGNKYGEKAFYATLLEYCDKKKRFDREQYYLDTLKPEYNFDTQVIANFGHSPSEEARQKISETLKKRYASGEIVTYKQQHAGKTCYVYDIKSYQLIKVCPNQQEVGNFVGRSVKSANTEQNIIGPILNKQYIVSYNKFKYKVEVMNYIYEQHPYNGVQGIVAEENGEIYYFLTLNDCAKAYGISASMLMKHKEATKTNPYIAQKQPNVKFYYIDKYIPLKDKNAVLLEESAELLSIKNGEGCDANPVVIEENKESSTPYSVEIEPANAE